MAASSKRKPQPATPEQLRWEYEVGPPRRPLLWYIVVVVLGLMLFGLFGVASNWEWTLTASPILWVCIMFGMALVPSRTRIVTLDRDLLRIRDSKHNRGIVEHNLREFAFFEIETIEEDRLNPQERRMKLQRRDGKGVIEFALPERSSAAEAFVERVENIVTSLPVVEPNLLQRFGKFADRWVGWR